MNLLKHLFGPPPPGLTADEAHDRLNNGNPAPTIIDVRQPQEYRTGHIKGAKLVPMQKLKNELERLPKNREILCVCHSGARSGRAVRQLNDAGLNALNLRGGMIAWERAGFPVKRGK